MRYLIKIGELEEKNVFFEKQIAKIDEYIAELKNVKNNMEWFGNSANLFYQKYDEYLKSLEDMKTMMLNNLLLFKQYFDNYNDEYERLKDTYNMIIDEEVIEDGYGSI